jgi:hypothetical protein
MMSLTQQNAAGLQINNSLRKRTDIVKHMGFCHCLTQPEVKFTHGSTTNKNICIISDAQNTTALQPNVFLTRIHCLLDTKNGRSPFPSAKSTANSSHHIYQRTSENKVPYFIATK